MTRPLPHPAITSDRPHISLSWRALTGLRAIPWSDVEVGGALFGWSDGHSIRVDDIELYPEAGSATDLVMWSGYFHQKFWVDGRCEEERIIVGDFHSHPGVDSTRASGCDLDGWQSRAEKWGAYSGLIVTPSGDYWDSGYPAGLDWSDPVLSGWVASAGGHLWSAPVISDDEEFGRMEAEMIFRPRRRTNA